MTDFQTALQAALTDIKAGTAPSLTSSATFGSHNLYSAAQQVQRRRREDALKPGGLMGAVQSGLGNGAVSGFLNVLDAPRRFVTSTIKESYDLGRGEGFDFGDWAHQMTQEGQIGAGDAVDTGNIWLDRALGFAGDVALDPLTYLTLGTANVVKLGARGLAREAFRNGLDDVGAQILRKGYTSLDEVQWQRLNEATPTLNLQGGARINLGRTRAGRFVVNTATRGRVDNASVRVFGKASQPIGKVLFKPLSMTHKIRQARWARQIMDGKFFSGDRQAARALIATGDDDAVKHAFQFMDAADEGRFMARAFSQNVGQKWKALSSELQANGHTGETLTSALDGNPQAIAALGEDYVKLKGFVDSLVENANESAGRRFLTHRDNWYPKTTSDEFSEYLRTGHRGRQGRKSFNRQGFEQKAQLVEGEDFMGVTLRSPGEAGIGVVEQAWEIFVKHAEERGGVGNAAKWFEDDLYTSMPEYLYRLSMRTGEQHTLQRLKDFGIAEDLWMTADDTLDAGTKRGWAEVREARREWKVAAGAHDQAMDDLRNAVVDAAGARDAARAARAESQRVAGQTTDALAVRDAGVVATREGTHVQNLHQVSRDVYAQGLRDAVSEASAALRSKSLVATREVFGRPMWKYAAGQRELAAAERAVAESLDQDALKQLGRRRPQKALPKVGESTHRLEQEVVRLEDEILAVQAEVAQFRPLADELEQAVAMREQVVERVDRYLEIKDERAWINAKHRQGLASDAELIRFNTLSSDMADLNRGLGLTTDQLDPAAELLPGPKAGEVLGGSADEGVGGELTRKSLESLRNDAAEEAALLRGYIDGPLAENPRFISTEAVEGARTVKPLENRLFDLQATHRALADKWAELQKLDEAAAREFATGFNTPVVGEDGLLRLRDPNGNETNVWFYGRFDESATVADEWAASGRQGAEGWLGPHVSHNPREAGLIEAGQEALSAASIRAENPRVYASDSVLGGVSTHDKALNTRGGFGSGRGAALTQVQNDMFMDAVQAGLLGADNGLSPAKIAAAARANADMAAGTAYGKTGRWKALFSDLQNISPEDLDGIAEAFLKHFGDVFRRNMGKRMPEISRARWVMNRVIDDAFGQNGFAAAKHKAAASDLFRQRLAAQGFDSVMYSGRDGNWHAIPFDTASVEDVRHFDVDDFGNAVNMQGNVTHPRLIKATQAAQRALAARSQESYALARRQIEPDFGPLSVEPVVRTSNRNRIRDWVGSRRAGAEIDLSGRKVIDANSRVVHDSDAYAKAERLLDEADQYRGAWVAAADDWKLGKINDAVFLESQADLARARVAELQALEIATERDMIRAAGGYDDALRRSEGAFTGVEKKLMSPKGRALLEHGIRSGYSKIDDDLLVPDWAATALRDQHRTVGAGDNALAPMLRAFDQATQAFKAWAVFSPGFHSRNLFGGMFNNHLAGVKPEVYKTFWPPFQAYQNTIRGGRRGAFKGRPGTEQEALDAALAKLKDPRDKEAFRNLVADGHMSGSGQTSEIVSVGRENVNYNPLSARFRPLQASRNVGEGVEIFLRGSLAFDRIRFGYGRAAVDGTQPAADIIAAARSNARDDVVKFHFDYDDLSQIERGVFRRIVPFYTWTRRNFPLQVEMMLTSPGKYTRFVHLKRNMEMGQEDFDLVPEYVRDQLHIRLPFDNDGDPVFWVPDLPFKELTRSVSPKQLAASSNPLIRGPVEIALNRKFFTGGDVDYGPRQLPSKLGEVVGAVPGANQMLIAAGLAVQDPDDPNEVLVPTTYQYMLESNLPVYNRLRRLAPEGDDEWNSERMFDSWLNFVTGLGINTITESEQAQAARGQ